MSLLRCAGLRLSGSATAAALLAAASRSTTTAMIAAVSQRFTHSDGTRLMSGEREIVGYGINGCPVYIDCADFPFPAIRYREVTPEVCALREKELSDWKKLSLQEKKVLYRHSFCQTYTEFQHFTPEWKLVVAVGLWSIAIAILISLGYNMALYGVMPDTFDEERRQAQLRRIIQLQMQPITGLSSKWCYTENKWK